MSYREKYLAKHEKDFRRAKLLNIATMLFFEVIGVLALAMVAISVASADYNDTFYIYMGIGGLLLMIVGFITSKLEKEGYFG